MPISFCREPLEPGLKLAATLRHIASAVPYGNMKFVGRVPANIISITTIEDYDDIIEEYTEVSDSRSSKNTKPYYSYFCPSVYI